MTYKIAFRLKSSEKEDYYYSTDYTFGGFETEFMAKTCAIGWYFLHANKNGFEQSLTGVVDIVCTIREGVDYREITKTIDVKQQLQDFIDLSK